MYYWPIFETYNANSSNNFIPKPKIYLYISQNNTRNITCDWFFQTASFHVPFRGIQLRNTPMPPERFGQKNNGPIRAVCRSSRSRLLWKFVHQRYETIDTITSTLGFFFLRTRACFFSFPQAIKLAKETVCSKCPESVWPTIKWHSTPRCITTTTRNYR